MRLISYLKQTLKLIGYDGIFLVLNTGKQLFMFNLEIKEMLIMKYKKIMLIALLLLAVLTISAVSASDDAALDNVTASDDVDVIVSDPDDPGDSGDTGTGGDSGDDTEEDEYGAWFNESEIYIGDDWDGDVVVARMTVPNKTNSGLFNISNDTYVAFSAPIGSSAWKTDEETKDLVCDVLLKDLLASATKIKNGDVIYFDFFDDEGKPIEDYCAQALYKFNYPYIQLVDIKINVAVDEDNDYNLSDEGNLTEPFAFISAPSEIKGNFTIYAGEEGNIRYYFNKNLTEMGGSFDVDTGIMLYSVSLKNLTNYKDFADEENFTIALLSLDVNYEWECADYEIYNDDGIISFTEMEPEIIIRVSDEIFYLDTESDAPFAFVSVPDGIKGFIVIYVDDDEDGEVEYFHNSTDDMVGKRVGDYTTYAIAFNDLNNYLNFVYEDSFTIAFLDDDEGEVESSDYKISYDDEENAVSFEEIEDVEGEGYEIPAAISDEANAVTDDFIVVFSKDQLPKDVEDEFDVYIIEDDDVNQVTLNLTDLEFDESTGQYFILVSDLFDTGDVGEYTEFGLIIQFYKGDEGVCYIESEEDVLVYSSPYVAEDGNLYEDDSIISFREIKGADELFTVTISKEGSDDIVKTFNITELENVAEDEEEAAYELKVSDLGLNESGEYKITVNFTKDGKPFISINGSVLLSNDLDISTNDKEGEPFVEIGEYVFAICVSEDFNGTARVFVDGTQVGGNITISDLSYAPWGDERGRQILLNNFQIVASGEYTLKVEVYNDKNEFLNNATTNVDVIVGKNGAVFNDVYYTSDGYIEFNLTAPVPVDSQFVIYLNGEEAARYRVGDHDIAFYDKFVDVWMNNDNARFLKVGHYDANITLVDVNGEKDFAAGSFNILSMNVTTDKEVCLEGQNVTISFDGKYYADKYSKLEVCLITGWGMMGPEDDLIFEFGAEELERMFKDGKFTVNIGNFSLGDNMLILKYMVAENKDAFDDEEFIVYATDAVSVKVSKPMDPNLVISVANITEGDPAVVTITTDAAFSGNVTVTIANKNYTVSVVNGKGTIDVTGLAANTYNATAIFAAQGIFLGSVKNTTFTVTKKQQPVTPAKKKDKIKLTLKKVKVKKSAKKLVLRATLKINGKAVKGKKITFKFKGKKYKAKTNKKGVAKVTIKKKVLKKLKVGKKVKYQATYGKVTKKYTVKVKR